MLYKVLWCFVNVLLLWKCRVFSQEFDFKLVTSIRHGLENSLDYIDQNLYRSTVDCVLGVAFVKGFMKSAFKNGSQIMDKSSNKILNKAEEIIAKSRLKFENDRNNGNNWKFKYLIYKDIWTKLIHYKPLSPFVRKPINNYYQNNILSMPNSDICLKQIVNSTSEENERYKPCVITLDCWNDFFKNNRGNGYYLTHKLLLLQIAKARKCFINNSFYNVQVNGICSAIMNEIIETNRRGRIEEFFDLFLEQVLLCGYEGYTDFIQNNWLFHILKSQRTTGCFSNNLNDKLKTRIKKAMSYFEDSCNDHTTGLGAAVLGLYYNYIVNTVNY